MPRSGALRHDIREPAGAAGGVGGQYALGPGRTAAAAPPPLVDLAEEPRPRQEDRIDEPWTYRLPNMYLPTMRGIVEQFNSDMEAKGFDGRVALGEPEHLPDDPHAEIEVRLDFSGMFKTSQPGWQFRGMYDFSVAGHPMRWGFDDGYDSMPNSELDPRRCDHCQSRRHRGKLYEFTGPDGERHHIGSSCMKDYTGHNPARILSKMRRLIDEVDGAERGGWSGRGRWNTQSLVTAAQIATEWRRGYVPTNSTTDLPTADRAMKYLRQEPDDPEALFSKDFAQYHNKDGPDGRLSREKVWAQASAAAREAIRWAREDLDPQNDFELNLKAAASSESVPPRAERLICYLPAAHARASERAVAWEERKRRERRLRETAPPLAASSGAEVTGTVISTGVQTSTWGGREQHTPKALVQMDDGNRVYGTIPDSAPIPERGDRVSFTANIEPSDDDEHFGLFKRPRRWTAEQHQT